MRNDWRTLIQQIDEASTTVLFGIGVVVLMFVASLMLASATERPTGHLLFDMGLWAAALALLGRLILLFAVRLRAASFGAEPPRTSLTTQDLLAHAVSLLLGPLLLVWFAPRLLELHPETWQEFSYEMRARWVDAMLVALGLLLIAWPIRGFLCYVTLR